MISMNSGELSLNTRRNVSFAAVEAAAGVPVTAGDAALKALDFARVRADSSKAPAPDAKTRQKPSQKGVIRNAGLVAIPLIARLDAGHTNRCFTRVSPRRAPIPRHSHARRHRNPKSHPRLICLDVTKRDRKRIRRIRRLRHLA